MKKEPNQTPEPTAPSGRAHLERSAKKTMKCSASWKFAVSLISVLLLSGCLHLTQMSEAEVYRAADVAAIKAGYVLSNFEPARLVEHRNASWLVSYEGRIPPADRNGMVELMVGNHFLVSVNGRTRKTQIFKGE